MASGRINVSCKKMHLWTIQNKLDILHIKQTANVFFPCYFFQQLPVEVKFCSRSFYNQYRK